MKISNMFNKCELSLPVFREREGRRKLSSVLLGGPWLGLKIKLTKINRRKVRILIEVLCAPGWLHKRLETRSDQNRKLLQLLDNDRLKKG